LIVALALESAVGPYLPITVETFAGQLPAVHAITSSGTPVTAACPGLAA
jgi:hypothetical protein